MLVFDNEAGGYIARVADFGYSTQWALPNDLIQMPRSRPWDAPEWDHRGFTPAQAMKMDSYSFGMVVLWLLGYTAVKDPYHTFERDLDTASEAADLARPLADFIFEAHKLNLNQFFNATLTHDEQIVARISIISRSCLLRISKSLAAHWRTGLTILGSQAAKKFSGKQMAPDSSGLRAATSWRCSRMALT